jgi:hypothetical protein
MTDPVNDLSNVCSHLSKPPILPVPQSGSSVPVTTLTFDQAKLHEYREKAASLYDLSKGVAERIGKAAESGTIEAARESPGELTLKTKEFEDFRILRRH